MTSPLHSSLVYLQGKTDEFEAKYFAAKKDEDKTFLTEGVNHYRSESAKVRAQLLDSPEARHPLQQELKFDAPSETSVATDDDAF